ncbi:GNAT family protein [Herbivorax sp. ANBcel31]|uniref:GNAT family N-acetyltransferase n=1 Tax=Herbivorax sp. ANBcel31 TaxID=3069754 RepID=UPI0027B0665E|nr:GNAT family protein [Herbivorax sp. ANBcel31]MDQ2087025.1 GNAT family protein [Herbivorax sp. ANBcel31]
MNCYIQNNDIIGLRKTKVEDLEYVLKTESNLDNKPYVGQWTCSEHKDALNDDDILHIIVEDYQRKKEVGYLIIAGLRNPNKALELKRIAIEEKGRGFGKETLYLIKKLAFEKYDFNRLWLDVRLNNERAQKIYKLSGFKEEGILREVVYSNGKYESIKIMSIIKSEY